MVRLRRTSAALVLALACATASAQPRDGLSADAYAVFAKWMTSSCLGSEARALEEGLRRYRVELEPAFRKALTAGPPPAELRRVRAAAEGRHAELAKMPLSDFRIEGISPRLAARGAAASTRESYAADEALRYANGYRSNALSGLAVVGGPEARALLSRMARRSDALAPAAREGLKTFDRQ